MFLKYFLLILVFAVSLDVVCSGNEPPLDELATSYQHDDFLLPMNVVINKDDGNDANDALPPLDPHKLPPDVHVPPEWQFPPGDDVVTLFPEWAPPERVSKLPFRHPPGGCLLSRKPSSAPHRAFTQHDASLHHQPSVVVASKYVQFNVVGAREEAEDMVEEVKELLLLSSVDNEQSGDDIGDMLDYHRTRPSKSDIAENNRPTPASRDIPLSRSLSSVSFDLQYATSLEEQREGSNSQPPPEDVPFYQEEDVITPKRHKKHHLKGSGHAHVGGPPMHFAHKNIKQKNHVGGLKKKEQKNKKLHAE